MFLSSPVDSARTKPGPPKAPFSMAGWEADASAAAEEEKMEDESDDNP